MVTVSFDETVHLLQRGFSLTEKEISRVFLSLLILSLTKTRRSETKGEERWKINLCLGEKQTRIKPLRTSQCLGKIFYGIQNFKVLQTLTFNVESPLRSLV